VSDETAFNSPDLRLLSQQAKAKTFQIGKKQKTLLRMNNIIQFEDKVSRSRSKHEGESSASFATDST
jgi:hypothetical protein